ncbi:MAG TPA: type IV pilin protein [Vicinamibacterales bacterium]|nr:type IV pilin protein [Vicinamibacterales bacterium]
MNPPALATPWARRRMAGVTLIELMTVVVVIGVLSMFAIPSYRQYVLRAQRAEAKSALLQLATNQERFYLVKHRYGGTADLTALDFATGKSERGTYALTIASADLTTGYTATATPTTGGAVDMTVDAMCTSFSLTATGVRTATGTDAANCW